MSVTAVIESLRYTCIMIAVKCDVNVSLSLMTLVKFELRVRSMERLLRTKAIAFVTGVDCRSSSSMATCKTRCSYRESVKSGTTIVQVSWLLPSNRCALTTTSRLGNPKWTLRTPSDPPKEVPIIVIILLRTVPVYGKREGPDAARNEGSWAGETSNALVWMIFSIVGNE
eukprot:690590-Rhodomonas_salina.2